MDRTHASVGVKGWRYPHDQVTARREGTNMIEYLLSYLRELQAQWHEAHSVNDGHVLEIWDRIVKVNDLIEAELTKF